MRGPRFGRSLAAAGLTVQPRRGGHSTDRTRSPRPRAEAPASPLLLPRAPRLVLEAQMRTRAAERAAEWVTPGVSGDQVGAEVPGHVLDGAVDLRGRVVVVVV